MVVYKACTKEQFAKDAGISKRTLQRWLKQFNKELTILNQTPHAKILNPASVKLLSEHFVVNPTNSFTYEENKNQQQLQMRQLSTQNMGHRQRMELQHCWTQTTYSHLPSYS